MVQSVVVMDDYQISEKDIESVIRYLELHDPENADRDYAVQLLEAMQGLAHDVTREGKVDIEELQKFLSKNQ